MSDSIQNNNLGEREVIVWIPFTVKLKDLQAAMMPSMSMLPQPIPRAQPQSIPVQEVQQEDTPALLPPSTNNAKSDEPPRGTASPKQMEWVHNIAKQQGMNAAEICKVTGAVSLSQMTKKQASTFINNYKDQNSSF